MSFELLPMADVVSIAAAGGGFTMDGTLKSTDDLVAIASAAAAGGARVCFTGIARERPVDDLLRIAAAGGGQVTFGE